MRNKSLITAVCAVAMLAPMPASATADTARIQQTEVVGSVGLQAEAEGNWVPSEEVNTVQESELTRKMKQAEKAKNAAENDKFGGAITIIAMSIVLAALVILSLLFLLFGKISSSIQKSKKREAHGVSEHDALDHHDEPDTPEVIAVIGMALAEHFGHGHDIEDPILTIRRMRKAYSPWNSKIYNMRHVGDHHKAAPAPGHK